MAKVGLVLGVLLIVQILYSFGVALVLAFCLKDKTHKRYAGGHVYAEFNGAEYHVPREVLEIYKHIKDLTISKAPGAPANPKVFFDIP